MSPFLSRRAFFFIVSLCTLPYCKVASGDGRLNHWEWECWLRVPDSYIVVVLASPDGSANGSWPPPADGCL